MGVSGGQCRASVAAVCAFARCTSDRATISVVVTMVSIRSRARL